MLKRNYILLFLIFSILIFPIVSAKSFSITNYDINYTLEQSGIVSVSEKLDYSLSGCFKELYLQRPGLEITNPSGYCQGATCSFEYKQTNTISGDPELILKGNFCDIEVTAYFNYNIEQQIRALEDGTQFYYQVYPGKTSVPTNANINIIFPQSIDSNQTTQFIHSQDYFSEINNNTLLILKHVGAYEIIEVNILMPKDWFNTANLYNYSNRTYTKAQIIEEETDWQTGYTQYTNENVKTEAPTSITILYFFFLFVFPILLLFIIWLIFGRDIPESKTGYFGIYERDLPGQEDPIQAHYFITGELSDQWFSSAIMYLVWKKQYELVKVSEKSLFAFEKYSLIKVKNAKTVELPSYVSKVADFFWVYYPDGDINLNDFRTGYLSSKKSTGGLFANFDKTLEFQNSFRELQKEIKKDLNDWSKKNKYFDKTGVIITNVLIIAYITLGFWIISVLFSKYIFPEWIVVSFWLFCFIMFLGNTISKIPNNKFKASFSVIFGRFSKEGRIKNLQWTNFKKYITDFSLIKEHPPQHVILWEEYMVYATAFGVAKEAAKALKTAMPEELSKSQNFVIYSTFATSSFSTSLGHSTGGSGGGGGFGGGGGGGGGAGAR
jgi:uncharacterized membrane protein